MHYRTLIDKVTASLTQEKLNLVKNKKKKTVILQTAFTIIRERTMKKHGWLKLFASLLSSAQVLELCRKK